MKIFLFLITVMMLILAFVFYSHQPTAEDIAALSSIGYPKAADFNIRIEKLYKKYGKGKSVPYVFVAGQNIIWEDIYYNIDFLLEDK